MTRRRARPAREAREWSVGFAFAPPGDSPSVIDDAILAFQGISPPKRGGTWYYCQHPCMYRARIAGNGLAKFRRHWRRVHP